MKRLGLIVSILGFALLVGQNLTITTHTYIAWVKESQALGQREIITHEDASAAARRLSLRFNRMFRCSMAPGTMMLVGTLLVTLGTSKRKQGTKDAGP